MTVNDSSRNVAFRFLGKVIEAEVLNTYFHDVWNRKCCDLKIISGDHVGSTLTVPVDFIFTNVEDARTKLHIGNKIKYLSGDGIYTGEIIDVDKVDGFYTVRDIGLPSEIFCMPFYAVDATQMEDGYYLEKAINGYRAMKGA